MPPPRELVVASMHGNCVFSNDDDFVKVRHRPGCSVVSGPVCSEGKVHFPLGVMWDAGIATPGAKGLEPGAWLRVDCGPATQDAEESSYTEVVKAEVFVGCKRVWSKDFSKSDPPRTATIKELITPIELDIEEEGPRALEVTLTLKFGENAIKFWSLAIYGIRPVPGCHRRLVGTLPQMPEMARAPTT